jgi:hypothetical protein
VRVRHQQCVLKSPGFRLGQRAGARDGTRYGVSKSPNFSSVNASDVVVLDEQHPAVASLTGGQSARQVQRHVAVELACTPGFGRTSINYQPNQRDSTQPCAGSMW